MSPSDIAIDEGGGVTVVGSVGIVDLTGWVEDRDPFVARFDATGERRWTRVVREHGDRDDDAATSIDIAGDVVAVGGTLGGPIGYGIDPPHVGWLARLTLGGRLVWMRTWGTARPQSVEHVALAPSGELATAGGLADHGYALVVRTYRADGDLIATDVVDPADGSLVGTGIAHGSDGLAVVATRYRKAYLDSAVGGRLWWVAKSAGAT